MTAGVVATTLNRMAMATAAFTIVSISCAVHGRLRRCCRAVGIEHRGWRRFLRSAMAPSTHPSDLWWWGSLPIANTWHHRALCLPLSECQLKFIKVLNCCNWTKCFKCVKKIHEVRFNSLTLLAVKSVHSKKKKLRQMPHYVCLKLWFVSKRDKTKARLKRPWVSGLTTKARTTHFFEPNARGAKSCPIAYLIGL